MPHKHKDLSSILHLPKKPGAMMDACNPSHSKTEERDTLISRTHWPASLGYLAKHRPLRSHVPNKGEDTHEMIFRWCSDLHEYTHIVCAHKHIPHTRRVGDKSEGKIIKMLYIQSVMFTVKTMPLFICMGFLRCTYTSPTHILVSLLQF